MAATMSLAEALTAEHHEIDAGIERFRDGVENGEQLATLAGPLQRAMTALRRHIYLEEVFAFPPIRAGGLTMPIMVMEREHGVLWRQMDDLEDALQRFDDEAAAEADRRSLVAACQEMLTMLESHNSKEEPIVYPHLDVKLSGEQVEELRRLIETGSTPEGWVCAKAGETV